jgi:hypothetical protein
MARCNLLAFGLRMVVTQSLALGMGNRELGHEPVIASISGDVRLVAENLCLAPAMKSFVCCPDCFCCYAEVLP